MRELDEFFPCSVRVGIETRQESNRSTIQEHIKVKAGIRFKSDLNIAIFKPISYFTGKAIIVPTGPTATYVDS